MLYDFLRENQDQILAMTEAKSLELAGTRPSSEQLRKGLPIFFEQIISMLRADGTNASKKDKRGMEKAAADNDESAMAIASGRPPEAALAKSAGQHGRELQRLGYTLSHVVHAYGAMCQSITEVATSKHELIGTNDFHNLNRCLDIAIAGAVTEYQSQKNTKTEHDEAEQLGALAHELRNALTSVSISFQLIKRGTVGLGGSTGQALETGLKRLEALIDRSLTEVRLRVDPKVYSAPCRLLPLVDQIALTAEVEAQERNQTLEITIGPDLTVEADQQLLHSALSNLIQNAIKYTRRGGKVRVRGKSVGETVTLEVEDECGGLPANAASLFDPFTQRHENRKGLGLGLTITQRAVRLNQGEIEVKNLPGKGCIFTITLPQKTAAKTVPLAEPAA